MDTFLEHKKIISDWFADHLSAEIKVFRLKKIIEFTTEIDKKNSISQNVSENQKKLLDEIENYKRQNDESLRKIIEVEQLIAEKQQLLDSENEINDKFKELQKVKSTLEELNAKKNEIEKTENVLDDLNDEITKINGKIQDKLSDYIIQLNALNSCLTKSEDNLESETVVLLNQAKKNIEAISQKQYSIIEKLSNTPIKTIYDNFDDRILTLTNTYNSYVVKIESIKNDLENLESKHETIIESFKQHGLENEKVFGNLKEIGEMDGINAYVESLKEEIRKNLNDFDDTLKKLIDKKKELPIYERI
jgi:chromosome segregation ATPase